MTHLLTFVLLATPFPAPRSPTPEQRAVAFLADAVPRWAADHACHSCHHNGDGARALSIAVRQGYRVPDESLTEVSAWLSRPERWKDNRGMTAASDLRLATLQFSGALVEAHAAGLILDAMPLREAADRVAACQDEDGGWSADAEGLIGSPTTHGRALATALAKRVLVSAGQSRYERAIARADAWARQLTIRTVPDAAGVMLALAANDDEAARMQKRRARTYLTESQARDGGWGPDRRSATEVFDTAIAVLALAAEPGDDIQRVRRRGRAYLVNAQQDDGGWPETTRPSGGESAAQRLSTSAWALLALLATRSD